MCVRLWGAGRQGRGRGRIETSSLSGSRQAGPQAPESCQVSAFFEGIPEREESLENASKCDTTQVFSTPYFTADVSLKAPPQPCLARHTDGGIQV